jgi:hypothetical protein
MLGRGKDGERRAIEGYAKAAGYEVVDWLYDAAVRGADSVTARPGFAAMLDRIVGNGVRTIIVESPHRFPRDSLKIATVRYDSRMTDFTTVLVAEQNLFQVQSNLAVASGNVTLGATAVYRALGGGCKYGFVTAATSEQMRARTNWGNRTMTTKLL